VETEGRSPEVRRGSGELSAFTEPEPRARLGHGPGVQSPHPFVKWAGGKASIAPRVVSLIRSSPYGRFFEPFVGGGAVFFELRPAKATLSDANPELINAYREIQKDVEGVITELEVYKRGHSRDQYYFVRSHPPEGKTQRAARFIYLNKTCFNGLWRVNSEGKFNVPMGSYRNPRIVDPPALRACSEALRHVSLSTRDFESVLSTGAGRPVRRDVVYLDPPYDPVSATSSFTSYTKTGFGSRDQARLARVSRALDRRGVRFVLSDSNTEFVRGLYSQDGFQVEQVKMGRSINSVGAKRGKISELLIWNF
jgi:DNA adenine methylase